MVVDSFRDLFWGLVGIFDGATHAAHLLKKAQLFIGGVMLNMINCNWTGMVY